VSVQQLPGCLDVQTLGRSSVKGLKRVSKGSASILRISIVCYTGALQKLTTAWRGSSRSSSVDFAFSWPFLPLGGILGNPRIMRLDKVSLVVYLYNYAARGGGGEARFEKLHYSR
jgi:hypothetical protein